MQFVQTLITDDQALKVRLAIDLILQDTERYVMEEDERQEYERLAVFFGHAASTPSAFAPTGQAAQTVKKLTRRVKGPAQPQSRRNKRKARQERRRAWQKIQRRERRAMHAAYNEALEAMLKEQEEAQREFEEIVARQEAEPKFQLRDPFGRIVASGIPKSAIEPMETEEPAAEQPHIILPGTAEALGLDAS